MQIKGEQLATHLERELRPVYLVYGDEPLLVIEAADAIRAAARGRGFDEREVLTVTTGFSWNELYHAAGSLSLFGGRTLIDLRLPTGKPGRDGSAAIQEYCARPSPDSLLLVSMNDVDWREEKSAWMNALATAGGRRQAAVADACRTAGLACRPPAPPAAGRQRLTACVSSPSASREICSRRIRKSSSSASSIRSAR
jgi:DNA polymerase III delta subunit